MCRRNPGAPFRAAPANRGATGCWSLPAFLLGGAGLRADATAIDDAFRLTGFFFSRHVYEPRGFDEPEARAAFLGALRRGQASPAAGSGEDAA